MYERNDPIFITIYTTDNFDNNHNDIISTLDKHKYNIKRIELIYINLSDSEKLRNILSIEQITFLAHNKIESCADLFQPAIFAGKKRLA